VVQVAPARDVPVAVAPVPVLRKKPLVAFGAAAALGALAGLVYRLGPPQFHRPKPGLLSRLKLR
jgi:hypothetical protein